MKEHSGRVARGVDVGRRFTKYTTGYDDHAGEVVCGMFPSPARAAAGTSPGACLGGQAPAFVTAGAETFAVGSDNFWALPTKVHEELDIDFPLDDLYLLLVREALNCMGDRVIDHLVVGLPVSSVTALTQKIRDRLTGRHDVGSQVVVVRQCHVAPQPVGGMWNFALRKNALAELKDSTCLWVDCGWFAMDWIVTTDMRIRGDKSGTAFDFGMEAVVRAVAGSLALKVSRSEGRTCEVTDQLVQRIDLAMRGKPVVKVNGREEPIEQHLESGRSVMRDGVQKMMASVGARSDIDRVILVGGAAQIFAPLICEVFGDHRLRISDEPLYANARGLHIIAMKQSRLSLAAI